MYLFYCITYTRTECIGKNYRHDSLFRNLLPIRSDVHHIYAREIGTMLFEFCAYFIPISSILRSFAFRVTPHNKLQVKKYCRQIEFRTSTTETRNDERRRQKRKEHKHPSCIVISNLFGVKSNLRRQAKLRPQKNDEEMHSNQWPEVAQSRPL